MDVRAGEDRVYITKSHLKRKDERATFRLVTIEEKGQLYAFATNLRTATPEGRRKAFRERWGMA